MKSNRMKNSLYNSVSSAFIALVMTVLSFVSRSIFINNLGEQLLGVDGLFTNILSLLSLAELGFGTAISFSLYEPIASSDNKKISLIMKYFKSVYEKIGIIIFIGGLICLPFLSLMTKGYNSNDYNLYIIFFLYLINTSLSYFTAYNSTLLEADQKNYKITFIRTFFNLLVYGLQILSLLVYKSFYLYLIILLVFRQIERIVTFYYIKKMYKNIIVKTDDEIDESTKKGISKNIKGILFHKFGDFVVNGTDNIIISSMIDISITGLYANYLSVVGVIKTIMISIINSTTSSFGNLNVKENDEVKYNVFSVINLIGSFVIGICCIGFFFGINDFIGLWVGEKFKLGFISVLLIMVNLFLFCSILPVNVVKDSSGLYYNDRYIGIVQAFINLVVSIVGAKVWGINGVLLGTTISYLFTVSWTKAYVIYKNVFKKNVFNYILKIGTSILILCISCLLSYNLISLFNLESLLLGMIVKVLISCAIYTALFVIFNFKTSEYKYLFNTFVKKGSK